MRKYKLHNGMHGAALTIRVTPRARKSGFGTAMGDGTLRVRLTSGADEESSNRALVAFMADVLGVEADRIEIVAGEKGLDKIVSVTSMSAENVETAINTYRQKHE
ncbi:MAG: DUF167 domain-containing protein [Anaerolineales bacterium]|nr:DUF167 domain-containing protein [Anaerolineales bacterium]